MSTDLATLTVTYDTANCDGVLTCDFTHPVTDIQQDGGLVVFMKDSTIVYQYTSSGTLIDRSNQPVPSTLGTTVNTQSVAVNDKNFDSSNDGSWTCAVTSSTKYNSESNNMDVLVVSDNCGSKRSFIGSIHNLEMSQKTTCRKFSDIINCGSGSKSIA